MADCVEGSAVGYKRDHRLLPGPKHSISSYSSRTLSRQPRSRRKPACVSASRDSKASCMRCRTSMNSVQGLVGSPRFATSGARYRRALALCRASHDTPLGMPSQSVVVVVRCYRYIRSTRHIGAGEFPADERLPGI